MIRFDTLAGYFSALFRKIAHMYHFEKHNVVGEQDSGQPGAQPAWANQSRSYFRAFKT
jgi:hypothetical protein